jgi:tripartite-type tricarboxylate transporter receptor subunit TctC
MERGEVNAIGAMSWEAIQTNHHAWLADKKIKVLYAQGARRIADLPNAPSVVEFASDDRSHAILRLISISPDIGRAIAAEPRVPAERAAALRRAFMQTMADQDFAAEMKKRNLQIEPLSGQDLQTTVGAAVATPNALVEQVKRYITP